MRTLSNSLVLLLLHQVLQGASATLIAPRCCDDSMCGSAMECVKIPTPCDPDAPATENKNGHCTLRFSCFAEDATVSMKDKGLITMKDLRVGDLIEVSRGRYEPVYAFGHQNENFQSDSEHYRYVEILLEEQEVGLKVTLDHLILVEGKGYTPAGSVMVGDRLFPRDESASQVVQSNRYISASGLYAPLTPSGTLIVHNISVSCYVSFQYLLGEQGNSLFSMSPHWFSHIGLSPIRMLCLGISPRYCQSSDDNGYPWFTKLGMILIQTINATHQPIKWMLLSVFGLVLGSLWVVECIVGPRMVPLLFVGIWAARRRAASTN